MLQESGCKVQQTQTSTLKKFLTDNFPYKVTHSRLAIKTNFFRQVALKQRLRLVKMTRKLKPSKSQLSVTT
ncbi:MAG: hypothetical protein CMR00_00870 [[Chlorobium] sp. 445]|nr:MAG: hypothetical protein CMR00_00870 [[Chlorobium] sp. 445]